MLIHLLKNISAIKDYFCCECAENNIAFQIDETLNREDILIIRVDEYYNHTVHNPDCSPDCLIIQRCQENSYNIYIVELKNIDSPDRFRIESMVEKFITCLDDFMSKRFGNYFHNPSFELRNIKLLFITDPYHIKDNPQKQDPKNRSTKMDFLISQRIPKFFGKHLYIEHKIPNPTIKKCS